MLAVSLTFVLGAGVFASVETPEDSAPSRSLRRLTTRFFLFRIGCPALDLFAPRFRPADDEYCDTSVGLELYVSLPVLPDAILDVFDFMLPNVLCILDKLESVSAGVLAPDVGWSVLPAQARNTASRMPGVKRESVRCDSDKAASRTMFFFENEAWTSVAGSRESAEI